MRAIVFAKRNFIELSRDILGYIFCIIFPIVMLVVMSVVNASIPKEAGMTLFRIDKLSAGILIFGQSFVMLFTAIQLATDKSSSFLIRLFSSPMKGRDFTLGYILPMLLVSLIQSVFTFVAAIVISLVTEQELNILGLCIAMLAALPSALMYICIGLVFGTLFNEKAAPGVCSVIISLGTFLGGVFFDAENVGGTIYRVCRMLPFIYCTQTARAAVNMEWESLALPFLVTLLSAILMLVLAIGVFGRMMKADK